jgi:hypothetical protein
LFFFSPPLPPLLPAPPLLPLSMLQLLLPMLDSSAEAALTKHLRHTLSVCMNLHLQRKCLTVSGCIRSSIYDNRQYSA